MSATRTQPSTASSTSQSACPSIELTRLEPYGWDDELLHSLVHGRPERLHFCGVDVVSLLNREFDRIRETIENDRALSSSTAPKIIPCLISCEYAVDSKQLYMSFVFGEFSNLNHHAICFDTKSINEPTQAGYRLLNTSFSQGFLQVKKDIIEHLRQIGGHTLNLYPYVQNHTQRPFL